MSPSLAQFYRSRERMVHTAKSFVLNPVALDAERTNQVFDGPRFLPLPGQTLDLGRNKAKREKRAAKLAQRAAAGGA